MTISNLRDVVQNCYEGGQYTISGFRKVPAVASVAGTWSDLTMAPGNPKPNYYTGAELTATLFDPKSGLFHGESQSPKEKYLHTVTLGGVGASTQAGTYILCDFLLFYPLVDMDSTDEQTFVNINTLPRYTDGDGVRALLVATNPYIGSQGFIISYTDYNGTSGVYSRPNFSNSAGNIGTVVNSTIAALSGLGPFIQGPEPHQGIRRVNSIQFFGPNGGLASLVLCKPLATITINEVSAFTEVDFLSTHPSLPRIYEGAVLGFIFAPGGSTAALQYTGVLTTIYN